MEPDCQCRHLVDENETLAKEVLTHYILHWNYRGYQDVPRELLTHGSHIQEIYYKENGLVMLPDDFDLHLPSLSNIYLHGNQLETLPTSLCRLNHLTVLEVSRNKLNYLPDEIGGLQSLVTLDLSNNFIQKLPESIGNLKQLQYLIIIRNSLVSIPASIGGLKSLISLHLSGNRLTHLPDQLSNCTNLIDLYVGANQLKYLPQSIANLPRLAHLCASINQIEGLPLLPFISLPRVFFDFNPSIKHIPFLFGCQQNVAALSSQRNRWAQRTQSEDEFSSNLSWNFQSQGCFQLAHGESNKKLRTCQITIKSQESETQVLTKLDHKLKQIFPLSATKKQIYTDENTEPPTLKEFCMRKLFRLTHGETTQAKVLGQSLDLIFVRKPNELTRFGQIVMREKYLPLELEQILSSGPTTFCCYPVCTGPIFETCFLAMTEFKLRTNHSEEEDEIPPHSPYLTSLYFCGPWCVKNLLQSNDDLCRTMKEYITKCDDIRVKFN